MTQIQFAYDAEKSVEFNEGRQAFLKFFYSAAAEGLDELDFEAEGTSAKHNPYDSEPDFTEAFEDFADGWNFELDNYSELL